MPIKCWVSCPVFSDSRQFFSLLRGNIENWMPIKCQRASKQEVGAEGSGPALVDSSIKGGESTPVDLDLKNPPEEWEWVASWLLNEKCWNEGGLL
jgi:hypothetical protein